MECRIHQANRVWIATSIARLTWVGAMKPGFHRGGGRVGGRGGPSLGLGWAGLGCGGGAGCRYLWTALPSSAEALSRLAIDAGTRNSNTEPLPSALLTRTVPW